jgi:hypothetical protein
MHIIKYSGIVLFVCFALSSIARGGILSADPAAYNDGTTTWSGSNLFTGGGGLVDVEVDYAVYAPGKFNASAVSGAVGHPVDPSNGNQYVYAYQLWNVGGIQTISGLSVGLAELGNPGTVFVDKQVANIGSISIPVDSPADVTPSSMAFNGTPAGSAVWHYSPGGLLVDNNSSVLIYTSPFPPHTDLASILGGLGAGGRLPSPVPEPATGLLLVFGAVCIFAIRFCRARD